MHRRKGVEKCYSWFHSCMWRRSWLLMWPLVCWRIRKLVVGEGHQNLCGGEEGLHYKQKVQYFYATVPKEINYKTEVAFCANTMEQGPSWETKRRWTGQEINCFPLNPKVRCHLARDHQWTTPSPYSLQLILILSFHCRLNAPNTFLPSTVPNKINLFFISPMPATCLAHTSLLNLMTPITGKE